MSDFFKYYESLFGERWSTLSDALLLESPKAEFRVQNAAPYFLDAASIFAAESLNVGEGMDVLDMCAAPGGKSLVLAKALNGTGTLLCNDRSPDRRERLRRVLENSLPKNLSKNITVSPYPAERFGMCRKESFDKILLDAPCSSERHVLHSKEHLEKWSEKRVKRLSVEQGALLASAIDATRPGGEILYSTCALNPYENDRVIAKLLKKRKGIIQVLELPMKIEGSERTEFGIHILPDRCNGSGPIFCAKLKKLL